jgi:predicted ATPase
MIHLREIETKGVPDPEGGFPAGVPVLRGLKRIAFSSPVTFLVGDNGSGKSTLLEAIACAAGSTTVGADSVGSDPTLAAVRAYAEKHLKLIWNKRTRRGFFMRSEDFFGYARRMAQTRTDLEQDLSDVDADYKGRSLLAQQLASLPYKQELGALKRSYGDGLDSQSHGESFFVLFRQRFTGEGLYLLDEPEAPLSPSRQLSLLAMLKPMVDQGAQFIIATHSPILMAYPGAQILLAEDGHLREAAWDSLEHVTLMRDFLSDPKAFLRHLFD